MTSSISLGYRLVIQSCGASGLWIERGGSASRPREHLAGGAVRCLWRLPHRLVSGVRPPTPLDKATRRKQARAFGGGRRHRTSLRSRACVKERVFGERCVCEVTHASGWKLPSNLCQRGNQMCRRIVLGCASMGSLELQLRGGALPSHHSVCRVVVLCHGAWWQGRGKVPPSWVAEVRGEIWGGAVCFPEMSMVQCSEGGNSHFTPCALCRGGPDRGVEYGL